MVQRRKRQRAAPAHKHWEVMPPLLLAALLAWLIVAAVLHNAGSLIVVFNSFRLIRSGEDLEQEPPAPAAEPRPAPAAALTDGAA